MNENNLGDFESGKNYEDMDDIEVLLRYENSDFMSSEFFDSVLSLENNMDQDFLSSLEDDVQISSDSSSHTDEVLSPQSFYSESDKNSSYTENSDEVAVNNEELFFESSFVPTENPTVEIKEDSNPQILKTQKTETKLFIQNPNNKKIIAKSIIDNTQLNSAVFREKPQILKIQSIDNSGGPILLPLNLKSFKILKTPGNLTTLSGDLKRYKVDTNSTLSNKQSGKYSNNQYPPLVLTQEEKRLLSKEGIKLPTHHPLTKNEERELKRIRRKIRNKISAQDSRKRKKEYVDGLEERVKLGSEENKNLLQRVRALQRQNRKLIAHVSKLQALIKNSTSSKATPSTCLMVVLLSALLVSLPNMKLLGNKPSVDTEEQLAIRRSLLSSSQMTNDDNTLNMEEFLVFKEEEKAKLVEEMIDTENVTDIEFSKLIEEMEREYETLLLNNNSKMSILGKVFETFKSYLQKEKPELGGKIDYGGYINNKGFFEPDIDDYSTPVDEGPPIKRAKVPIAASSHSSSDVIFTPIGSYAFDIETRKK